MIAEATKTESESALEGLSHALDWLRQHSAAELVTVIGFNHMTRRPFIFFYELATMRRLLPGLSASVESRGSSERWTVVHAGIEFEATRFVHRGANSRSEVL